MQYWEENNIAMYFVKPVLFQMDSDDQSPYVDSEYSLEKILEFNKDIIITGAPGSGKTTLLKYIEHVLHKSNEYCSIFVSLRDIESLKNWDFDNAKNGLTTVFLLDGLDETPVSERKEVARTIGELRNIHHRSRFIITSRLFTSYEFSVLQDFVVLRISELNDSQIEHLFKLHGVEDYKRAFAAILLSSTLNGLDEDSNFLNVLTC